RQGYVDSPSFYDTIKDPAAIVRAVVDDPAVVAVTPRVRSAALAFLGEKATGVSLLGVDPEREVKVTTLASQIESGRMLSQEPGEIVLGIGAAETLRAKLGDEVFLISQGVDGSIANDVFRVVGLVGEDKGSPYRHALIT